MLQVEQSMASVGNLVLLTSLLFILNTRTAHASPLDADAPADADVTNLDKRSVGDDIRYADVLEAVQRYIENHALHKRASFRYDMGKRDDLMDELDAYGSVDGVSKRANFRNDLGKRAGLPGDESSFEKRGYRADLGKRVFGSDFGKRYRYDMGKRGAFRADMGKRGSFRADMGKRGSFRTDMGKRGSFRTDMGKRTYRADLG